MPLGVFIRNEGATFGQLPVGQSVHRMVQQIRIVDSRHVPGRIGIEGGDCHLVSLCCISLELAQSAKAIQGGFTFSS